jgi:DNA-binding SARP family transcriptional activator
MDQPYIAFLGGFHVGYDAQRPISGLEGPRVRELLAYLLLQRQGQQQRERLAALFWPDLSLSAGRKYLRQALWRIQSALEEHGLPALFVVDDDSVQAVAADQFELDVHILEAAYQETRDLPGDAIHDQAYCRVLRATQLYRGDLLPHCYQDWCIFERERLQSIYLILLDKLMAFCEAHGRYEEGLIYGQQILRCECAHERTHRRLMRLYARSGDRTAALRQYEQCCATLERELNVAPSAETRLLYEAICTPGAPPAAPGKQVEEGVDAYLREIAEHLASCQEALQAYLSQQQRR